MADVAAVGYKSFHCYTAMREKDRERLDRLVEAYGPILNAGPKQGITRYTSHNFDRHCTDLYRIISMFLLRDTMEQLSKEELYLLNVSVLLHDISMCQGGWEGEVNTAFNREIHSLQSAQWIRHEHKQKGSALFAAGLNVDQIEIICDICQAHSTLKDRDDPSGLEDPNLRFKRDGYSGEVRVKALAGILRIADELDVTRDRLTSPTEMDELLSAAADDGRPEVKLFIEQNEESGKHFRRLMLVNSLKRAEDDATALELKLDDAQVQKRMDQGDGENLAEDLREIMRKIKKELDGLWSKVLTQPEAGAVSLVPVKEVRWSGEDMKRFGALFAEEPPLSPVTLHPIAEEPQPLPGGGETEAGGAAEPAPAPGGCAACGAAETPAAGTDGGAETEVGLLDAALAQQIREEVRKKDLLVMGHYQLNTVYCARDWVKTETLIDRSSVTNHILQAFAGHIWTSFRTESFTIVGLDLMGAKLAAQIGFMLRKPFTYVIPAHQYARADSHEVGVPGIPEDHKIVLVTDSIVTGGTVLQVIQGNGDWEKRALAVYTVLYRRPRLPRAAAGLDQLPCKVHALNTDFPAEISPVVNCPYRAGREGCRAENRKL